MAGKEVLMRPGFFGYGIHRTLKASGIESYVINPSDIPSSKKDILSKTDRKLQTIIILLLLF